MSVEYRSAPNRHWPGDDTWVVLVHDVGDDIDVWRPLRVALAARGWSVLALDLRGHGGSDWSEAVAYRPADYAADIVAALDALG